MRCTGRPLGWVWVGLALGRCSLAPSIVASSQLRSHRLRCHAAPPPHPTHHPPCSVTKTDVDLIFASSKAKGSRRLTFDQYLIALDKIAQKKYPDVPSDEAFSRVEQQVRVCMLVLARIAGDRHCALSQGRHRRTLRIVGVVVALQASILFAVPLPLATGVLWALHH
jgi:hypothetical protein